MEHASGIRHRATTIPRSDLVQFRLCEDLHKRKNWLHLDSKEAGPKIAAILTVVESCRRLGIPVRHYLADILPGLADAPIRRVAELTATAWAAMTQA